MAAGIFYYLFKKIPPRQVWSSLQYVQLIPFLGLALLYFFSILALDTWNQSKVISRFSLPVSFSQIWPGRIITYLLALVNYNAGQAGLAYYVKKTQRGSFFKTLGAVFFVTVIDLYWLIFLAFIGSFFFEISYQGIPIKVWVQKVSYIAFLALFLHLAFWNRWFSKIIPNKIHFGFGDWLRGRHLFQAFHHATLRDYFALGIQRLPLHLTIIAALWFVIRLFGAKITWVDVIGIVPVIYLIGAIPITPGGLGTVQLAMVELLKNRISSPLISDGLVKPEDLLFAISLSWMAANYGIKALLGAIYWLRKPSDLFQDLPTESPDNAPHLKK